MPGVAAQVFKNKRGLLRMQVFDLSGRIRAFPEYQSEYIDDMSYKVRTGIGC